MNKFQIKMFIAAMFQWFALLLLNIIGLILELLNLNGIILAFKEASDYSIIEPVLLVFMAISPLIVIPLIIFKVIIPCYKGIIKGEIW
jgi:hypothetical protein